jgi:hypothetical protein
MRRVATSLAACAALALLATACPSETKTPSTSPEAGPTSQPAKTSQADDHAAHGKAATDREQVDADGVVRRGAKLSELAALTITEATQKSGEIDGKLVKLTGKVDSVCQPMGCWMVLAGDNGEKVRITSKGHDIFVPKAAAGRLATVEGEFKLKTLPKETAQHFEDERELKAGETKKTFTEDQKEFSVSVVGLELKPAA